jgi:hypothetical protein
MGLEGIVSKRIDTPYRSGPFLGWRNGMIGREHDKDHDHDNQRAGGLSHDGSSEHNMRDRVIRLECDLAHAVRTIDGINETVTTMHELILQGRGAAAVSR